MVTKPPNTQQNRKLQMPTNLKKVLAKKLEANNQKLGAHTRNLRGYVFGFRVSGLGFELSGFGSRV